MLAKGLSPGYPMDQRFALEERQRRVQLYLAEIKLDSGAKRRPPNAYCRTEKD
jgi:hypothetical protein